MYDLIKSLNVHGSILTLRVTEDKIFAVTNNYAYTVYDKKSLTLLNSKIIASKLDARNKHDKSFAISSKLDFFMTHPESSKSFLMKYEESLGRLKKIQVGKEALYCSSFNHCSDLLALGGEDGKSFFYSLEEKKVIKSLSTKPDWISNISFSKDDKFAAVSSFDKTVTIYSFEKACETVLLQCNNVVVESIFINNNSKLFAVTRDKNYIVYDLLAGTEAKYPFELDDWPSALLALNNNYTIIGDRAGSLYIINNTTGAVLDSIKFENKAIASIEMDENHLYVAFTDGEIKIINMHSNLEQFKLSLKLNNFTDASRFIEKNIFLAIHEVALKLDKDWHNILADAKQLIAIGKKEDAKKLVEPFFYDVEKKEEFLLCLGNSGHYEKFSNFIKLGNYPEAFKLADKLEFLKNTKDYTSIEKHFVIIFQQAKQLFKKDDEVSIESAKKMLTKYSQVSSKRILVNNLMIRYKIFIEAERLIKNRNFKEYFILHSRYDFLEDEEIYKRVTMIAQKTLNHLEAYVQAHDYDKALEVAQYLKDFLTYEDIVNEKINTIKTYQALTKSIENENIKEVYETVQGDSTLEVFPPFLIFHEKFKLLRVEAHKFSIQGDGGGVQTCFKNYLDVKYTLHVMAQEFKNTYLTQIKRYLDDDKESTINWEKTIAQYCSFFGLDNDLITLLDACDFNNNILDTHKLDVLNGYENKDFIEYIISTNL